MDLNRSCPAVSQMDSYGAQRRRPRQQQAHSHAQPPGGVPVPDRTLMDCVPRFTCRQRKSTPTVETYASPKESSAKRSSSADLPTAESPMRTSLKSTSLRAR